MSCFFFRASCSLCVLHSFPTRRSSDLLGEVTVLVRDGKYTPAREALRRALDIVTDDIELHQHYHKLLMLLDDQRALGNHCEYFLGLLKRNNQLGSSTAVLLEVQSPIPDYLMDDSALAVELAHMLQRHRAYQAVLPMC